MLGVQYITSHPRVVPSVSLTHVKTTSPTDFRATHRFRSMNKSNTSNMEEETDANNCDEMELLEMAGSFCTVTAAYVFNLILPEIRFRLRQMPGMPKNLS